MSPAYVLFNDPGRGKLFYDLSGSGRKRGLRYPAGEVWWQRHDVEDKECLLHGWCAALCHCFVHPVLEYDVGGHANDTFHLNLENLWDTFDVSSWLSLLPRAHGKRCEPPKEIGT